MKTLVKVGNFELSFVDDDVVNIDDIDFDGDYNPHGDRLWLLHDHGFTVCVVQASNLQDALDIAVDESKMERYLIGDDDRMDYLTSDFEDSSGGWDKTCPEFVDENGVEYWWERQPAFLGNASEPHDIDTLGYVELPLPKRSVTRLFGESITVDVKKAFFA